MQVLRIERIVLGVLLAVTAAGWTGRAAAQAPQSPDVLPALLTEVRGLRAAMEQMASAGPRVQLFASRLQLQETRINNLIRRQENVRDNLANAQREFGRVQGQQRQFEAALAEHRATATAESREEAKQAEFMLDTVKRSVAEARASIDRLTAEDAQLSADITTEQARWTDINSRLDDLEKLLTRK